jgi:hypothetical protein
MADSFMADRGESVDLSDNPTMLIPSPAQIEAAAAEIRAGWSRAEMAKRAGVELMAWNVPIVSAADLVRAAKKRGG